MIRLLCLNRQFATGGAERQLITFLQRLDRTMFNATVASFYAGGGFGDEMKAISDIRWVHLEKRGRWDIVGFLFRALRLVREAKPDIIYGYMGPSHPLSLLLGKFSGAKVVWGVRSSGMDSGMEDGLLRFSFWLECKLSRFADLIIANSNAGRNHVIAKGFTAEKVRIIPNGIDTSRFRPDPDSRIALRSKWGITGNEKVVGLVARIHPMKDHPAFLKAAGVLVRRQPGIRFVCIGDGTDDCLRELKQLSERLGISRQVIWDGERGDIAAAYSALDIMCSASAYGEGFSNAIAEAMACGVPCVVTDVGDSSFIVGDCGIVVPPRDHKALADGMETLLALSARPDIELRRAVRDRIVNHFAVETMITRTQDMLAQLLVKP